MSSDVLPYKLDGSPSPILSGVYYRKEITNKGYPTSFPCLKAPLGGWNYMCFPLDLISGVFTFHQQQMVSLLGNSKKGI
jgi:hypothetical protein